MKRARLVIALLVGLGQSSVELAAQDMAWSTYRSDPTGFSIAFPADWKLVEARPRSGRGDVWAVEVLAGDEQHKVTFLEEAVEARWPGRLVVRVLPNPKGAGAREWLEAVDWEDERPAIREAPVMIGGREAIAWVRWQADSMLHGVTVVDGERVFEITYELSEGNDPALESHRRIFERMVGSFRLMQK